MASRVDNLLSVAAAAKKAHWGATRFKKWAAERGLLINNGGGEQRKLFVVNWPEVEKAILQRPRHTPTHVGTSRHRRPPRRPRSSLPNPDVYC